MTATTKWITLALLGLLIAGAVAFLASRLVSEQIGIASESVSAGYDLAPAVRNATAPSNNRTDTTTPSNDKTTPPESTTDSTSGPDDAISPDEPEDREKEREDELEDLEKEREDREDEARDEEEDRRDD